MKKKRILFFYTSFSSFVQTDYEILSEKYEVTKYIFVNSKNFFSMFWEFIKQVLFLFGNLFTFDIVYCWFADYHTLIPLVFAKLLNKKSFLVLGGYDVANIPELKYGSFSNVVRKFCATTSIRYSTLCLAVSDNIKEEAISRIKNANISILYTGYSGNKFYPKGKKKDIILTVSIIDNFQRIKIKGIDYFIETAKKMPQYTFIIIGMLEDMKNSLANLPRNLQIFGIMEQEEIIKYYQKAKIYIQLSLREGLPNSVCEDMLCECIPVGLDNGGIPIAIGDSGFIIKNHRKIPDILIKAINLNENLGKKARERIIEKFSLKNRKIKLNNYLLEK